MTKLVNHRRTGALVCGRGFSVNRCVCLLSFALTVLTVLTVAPAQARQERVESLILRVFSMSHQPAREALPLVDTLLSPRGSVSLQQEDNALVIKDHSSVMKKLETLLNEFDHPTQYLTLELYLLRASRSKGPPDSPTISEPIPGLPEELIAELSNILSLNSYQALGSAQLRIKEGQRVRSKINSDYEFRFDVGTVLRNKYLKLSDFRVFRSRGSDPEQVYRSNVNLQFRRPAFITVSRDAASASGLVVALVWKPPGPNSSAVSPVVPGNP